MPHRTHSGHIFNILDEEISNIFECLDEDMQIGLIMTQYHVKTGLKVFGDAGVSSVKREMQQLHDHKIPKPVHPKGLSQKEFNKVLEYLIFFKEK